MAGRMSKLMGFSARNVQNVPNQSGVYEIQSDSGVSQYVGMAKAGNLQDRLMDHVNEGDISSDDRFRFRPTSSTREAQKLEQTYINRLNPKQNKTE